MSYNTLKIGDDHYQIVVPFEATYELGVMTFTAEGEMKVVPLCEHCGNFRLEPIVLYSVDELISAGWIKKKEDQANARN